MEKEGRSTLVCGKNLPCGVVDRFTVVVEEKSNAENKYKSMWCEVGWM